MALIKTLKDFLTKNTIYPTTKTRAVYDDTVGRLDTYLHNTLGAEPIDNVEEETAELRDADTLGGRYTAEDLDAMPKSSAVEDYANVEPPMNDADALGGKKASEYVTREEIDVKNITSGVKNLTDESTGIEYTLKISGNIAFFSCKVQNFRKANSGWENIIQLPSELIPTNGFAPFGMCSDGQIIRVSGRGIQMYGTHNTKEDVSFTANWVIK